MVARAGPCCAQLTARAGAGRRLGPRNRRAAEHPAAGDALDAEADVVEQTTAAVVRLHVHEQEIEQVALHDVALVARAIPVEPTVAAHPLEVAAIVRFRRQRAEAWAEPRGLIRCGE